MDQLIPIEQEAAAAFIAQAQATTPQRRRQALVALSQKVGKAERTTYGPTKHKISDACLTVVIEAIRKMELD